MSRVGATIKLRSFETISNIALTSCSRAHQSRASLPEAHARLCTKDGEQSSCTITPLDRSQAAIEDQFVGWLLTASRCTRHSRQSTITNINRPLSRPKCKPGLLPRRPFSTRAVARHTSPVDILEAGDESPFAAKRRHENREDLYGDKVAKGHGEVSRRKPGTRYAPFNTAADIPKRDVSPGNFIGRSGQVDIRSQAVSNHADIRSDSSSRLSKERQPSQGVLRLENSMRERDAADDTASGEHLRIWEDVSVSRFELHAPASTVHDSGVTDVGHSTALYKPDEVHHTIDSHANGVISAFDTTSDNNESRFRHIQYIQKQDDKTQKGQPFYRARSSLPAAKKTDDLLSTDEELIELSRKVLRREPISPENYIEAVDIYGGSLLPQTTEARQRPHLPLAPRLALTPEQEENLQRRTKAPAQPTKARHVEALEKLRYLIGQKVGAASAREIWRLFASLEEHGLDYLSSIESQHLFSHLGRSEYRDRSKYNDLLLDLFERRVRSNMHLTKSQWSTAILLVGRSGRRVQTKQVVAALRMWMRMEEHSSPANATTFNMLIEIVLRSGRYPLADALIDEVKARGLRMDRYLRFSLIHYAGLRRDGDAVRAAFNDFVNAREIVDTSVMNAVIRSLCEAEEIEAAEHVLANMKELHAQKFPAEYPKVWRDRKRLHVLLNILSEDFDVSRQNQKSSFFGSNLAYKEKHEALQQMTPIHPDGSTYRILIGNHALRFGKAENMFNLIEQMRLDGFRVTGSTYQKIFKGFQLWGDEPQLGWTAARLEKVWSDFVHDLPADAAVGIRRSANVIESDVDSLHGIPEDDDENSSVHDQPLHFTESLARKILRAFEQHCGHSRMERVWVEILARWKSISHEDQNKLEKLIRNLIRSGSKRDPRDRRSTLRQEAEH